MPEHLHVERRGAVTVVAFDRPSKRNALTREALRALPELLQLCADDAAAIVLTGGPDVFSAGVDLAEIGNGADDVDVDYEIATVSAAIRGLAVPVIAAVEGPCVGAAVELALACDVRVVASDAFFSVPAVHLGALYRPEGLAYVVRAAGAQTAMRLFGLGESIPGDAAGAAGLAALVTGPGEALDHAVQLASLASRSNGAAVDATKQVIQAALRDADLTAFDGLRHELLRSPERLSAVAQAQARHGSTAPRPS
jgi:enoyl-CoA hydratase/carnithine racemase